MFYVDFLTEKDPAIDNYNLGNESLFSGKYLETYYVARCGSAGLLVGCGREEKIGMLQIKEIFAKVSSEMKKYKISECTMNVEGFVKKFGEKCFGPITMGLQLGEYEYTMKTGEKAEWECQYRFNGVDTPQSVQAIIREASELAQGIMFARDMTNTPGNLLRPADFATKIEEFEQDTNLEIEILEEQKLRELGLNALLAVGEGSAFRPHMVILRHRGGKDADPVYGLVGKGITCDSGGYCVKSAGSMAGIKGDMAGAAAVAGTMHAIAKMNLPLNVTACIPICENRISEKAALPGDVIVGYGGKTIEILNTDAEGRLILADAVAYGVDREKMSKVVDIATLTGAAWSALGYTIGAMMCDDEFYEDFAAAQKESLETYVRFPFGSEHEKMIESNVADIKNTGGNCCGVMTAGLFIRAFAKEVPWMHLDIAGTAWCENPAYAFESKGATGAGVTSMYYLLKQMVR